MAFLTLFAFIALIVNCFRSNRRRRLSNEYMLINEESDDDDEALLLGSNSQTRTSMLVFDANNDHDNDDDVTTKSYEDETNGIRLSIWNLFKKRVLESLSIVDFARTFV